MRKFRAYIDASADPQRTIAGRLGISSGHLGDLLSGRRTPGLELAVRIEAATDGAVPVSSWFEAQGDVEGAA